MVRLDQSCLVKIYLLHYNLDMLRLNETGKKDPVGNLMVLILVLLPKLREGYIPVAECHILPIYLVQIVCNK